MHAHRLPLTTALPLALGVSTLFYQGPWHGWARAHAGDALAVAFLAGMLGAFTPWSQRLRFALIALLATAIEFSQLIDQAAERGHVARLFLGSHFDALDFVYYGAGLLLALALESGSNAVFAPVLR